MKARWLHDFFETVDIKLSLPDTHDVFTPEEKTARCLSSVKEKAISTPREELDAKAQAGYHFVAEQKNPKVQMKRVLDMFETKTIF